MKKHLVEWTPQERTELKGIIDANRMAAPAGRLPSSACFAGFQTIRPQMPLVRPK